MTARQSPDTAGTEPDAFDDERTSAADADWLAALRREAGATGRALSDMVAADETVPRPRATAAALAAIVEEARDAPPTPRSANFAQHVFNAHGLWVIV